MAVSLFSTAAQVGSLAWVKWLEKVVTACRVFDFSSGVAGVLFLSSAGWLAA